MPMYIRSITLVVSESDIWCSSRETQKALSGSSSLRTWGSSERSGPLSGDPRGSKATRSRHATFMTRVYLSSGCFIWSTPYCGLRHGSAVVSSPDRCRGSVVGRVLTSQAVVVTVQDASDSSFVDLTTWRFSSCHLMRPGNFPGRESCTATRHGWVPTTSYVACRRATAVSYDQGKQKQRSLAHSTESFIAKLLQNCDIKATWDKGE